MADICVTHLVWKPLGLEPLRNFLASYKRNPAGMEHRLVVAFNGFDGEEELREYHKALEGLPHEWFFVSPPTQDIPVYFEAARRFNDPYFCFLNSHSVILDEKWLAKMYRHISREDVGVVGATGSWASHYSGTAWELGMPSAYGDIFAEIKDEYDNYRRLAECRPVLFQLSEGLKEKIRRGPLLLRLTLSLYYYGVIAPYYLTVNSVRWYYEKRREKLNLKRRFPAALYDGYPAPHLRTNAFIIRREMMLRLKTWDMPTKDDAYRFESGKESLTNQVLRMGLKVMVVGRDGRAYEKEEWPLSETLWQGEQRNLLVADNNTRNYALGDRYQRTFMSLLAWGMEGAPALPDKSST